ncbi:Ig-like domain-containing protein [Blautia marasmi]|uniref:Ig-like domain-containing protein n=1 Tax=Blautia marasmi TaxID=1917868 RepID=UPI001D083DAB|nr:Ig-like domain-containing protein [Blautia marasmi]MCB6192824.1 Ig-like domain-containing protein [Blautia marasmi]
MREKTSLKKCISIMLSVCLCIQIALTGTAVNVKADGETTAFTVSSSASIVQRGDEFTVFVDMGETIAQGIEASLFFDADQLELVSKKRGEGCNANEGEIFFDVTNPQPGEVRLVGALMELDAHMIGGNVLTATFRVKDNAKGNVEFFYEVRDLVYTVKNPDGSAGDAVDIASSVSGAECVQVSIPVTGVKLDKDNLTLNKGESAQLQASVIPEDADEGQNVVWSTSDENVATVENGKVTASGKGTAVVTASIGGQSANCTVTVTNALTGIKVTGDTQNLKKGQITELHVQYIPEDADVSGNIVWTSSDEKVASVSNGVVTAVGDGTATITASVGSLSDTYSITVKEVHIESISVKESTTIHRGESETLAVIYNPAETTDDKKVSWSSSDDSVATVDVNGTVTAVNIGKAIIKANVAGKEDTCVVTVDAPLKEILTEKECSLIKGQKQKILYELNPQDTTDSKEVTFVSSDPSVAEVDANTGEVTALKEGNTTITLTGVNNITAEVAVNVKEIPIDTLVLNEVNKTLEIGESFQLEVVVNPENTTDDQTITWSSSDEEIATVDENGFVTALKGGKATITAASVNGKTATCEIFVPIHMTGIKTPETMEILKGNTGVIKVEYLPEDTTDSQEVTWHSDNEQVAVVDEDGMVIGLKEGTANITAFAGEFTSTTMVTVKEIHIESVELVSGVSEIIKGQTFDLKSALKINPENTTDDKTVTWTTSDEKVAIVDQNGVLTAVSAGTVVVTATIGELSCTMELQIKEIPLESIAFDKVIESMEIGEKAELKIIYNPQNTTDIQECTWYSSDDNVISVENGILTANKAGKATITAKAGDKTVSCEIKVNEKKQEVVKPTEGDKKTDTKEKDKVTKTSKNVKAEKAEKAKTSQSKSIKTGDASNPALYVILMFAMADMIGILLIIRRKRYR